MSEEEKQQGEENLDDSHISIIESIDREILEQIPPNDRIISYHLANEETNAESKSKD